MMHAEREQKTLIEQAQADDEVALAALFGPEQDRLFSYVYRWTGHWHMAEDLAQDVLIKAMKALPRYRHRGHFRAWLFTIARREVFSHMRREKVRSLYRQAQKEAVENGTATEDDPAIPSRWLEQEEQAARVRDLIRRLPARERDVIYLRTYSELSFREIAEIQGCPLNTALSRVHRAMKRLKTWMEEDDEKTEP